MERRGGIVFLAALLGAILGSVLTLTLQSRLHPRVSIATPPVVPVASVSSPTGDSTVSIVKRTGPAVVSITSLVPGEETFFGVTSPKEGQGSGFIISPDGIILTNSHVVAGSSQIRVRLSSGRVFPGRLLGQDPRSDVAVVKVDAKDLPVATLGNSSALQVGEPVVAIGNPMGFQSTVTTGVVSALNRTFQPGAGIFLEDVIQTDAAINPGNSGGPLLNGRGEVIGINTLIIQSAQNLGFAISINNARRVAEQLIAGKHVIYPWLGAQLVPLTEEIAVQLGTTARHGVVIAGVVGGGPAAQAGIQEGDVVLAADGKPVDAPDTLIAAIQHHKVGDSMSLRLLRGGSQSDITVVLGERPVQH